LDRLFDVILEQLARVIHYDSSAILLRQNGNLRVVAARGFDDVDALLQQSFGAVEDGLFFRVMNERQAVVIDDVRQHPDWRDTDHTQHVQGWIGAPLMTQDGVFGVLAVDSRQPYSYTNEDAQVVTTFAHQAAIALANARLVEKLQVAEARYARLFEDSTDMILIFDYQGRVLEANRKACELLCREKTSLVGLDVAEIETSLRARFNDSLSHWHAGQEKVFEVDVLVSPGHVVSVEFRTKCTDYGKAKGIQWSGRDISARRELEQLRQDLTNMLVHDLRGPMGNLIGAIETIPSLLGELSADSPVAQLIDVALNSGQHLRDLVDSMLDVSRLEQGKIPLNLKQISVDELLHSAGDQATAHAEARQVELALVVDPSLKSSSSYSCVSVDPSMMRRVLVNLIENSIKYSPAEGQVCVTARRQGSNIIFSIIDQGPGIPPEYRRRIFDKFARVKYEGAPSGVGLGLAFCRLAVEAHGGHIWVEDAPPQGSSFSFTLPVTKHR
jgi:PAS domain S-box-containing protein